MKSDGNLRSLPIADVDQAANVPLYEHFGFVCMEVSVIRGTGLTVWVLRRPVQ